MRPFTEAADAEFRRRHEALRQALGSAGLSHAVFTTTEHIFYLTGATFKPLERPFFLVVSRDGERRMLVPLLELDHLHKAWGLAAEDIVTYAEFPAPEGAGWVERFADLHLPSGGFAFEVDAPWALAEHLLEAGGTARDLLGPIRLVKSPWELTQIERAARYADWGVGDILRRAWPGATAAETYMPTQALQRKLIREVAEWDPLSTEVIAAAWPAPISAQPHAVPNLSDRLRGGPHVAMVLTRVNGYAAESERTFFTQTPTARERECFAIMQRARQIAFDLVRPGVPCAEIDAAVNGFLAGEGFADPRTRLHRCGHGFGQGNHEPPWIAEGSSHVLQEHMVISIEPGLYDAGVGGYRHSDTVVVTADGWRSLTRASTDLDSLTVSRTRLRHRVNHWLVKRTLGL